MSWIFSKVFSVLKGTPSENSEDKMSSLVSKRLQKELELVRKQNKNIELISVSEDLMEWKVIFKRPSSSNYEGFKFDF